MILVALCALVRHQGAAPPANSASGLISKMFSRYAAAKTLSGKIVWVQTAASASAEVDTAIAFEKPNLIFLDQREIGGKQKVATIVSDGTRFSYTSPDLIGAPPKLIEPVHKGKGVQDETVASMYEAGSLSLIDRAEPVATMIARLPDLRTIAGEFASYTLKGPVKIGDRTANWVTGQWRQDPGHPVSRMFDIYITDDGDLVRYQTKELVRLGSNFLVHHNLPADVYKNGVEVVSTWDVNVVIDQPVNHRLFHL